MELRYGIIDENVRKRSVLDIILHERQSFKQAVKTPALIGIEGTLALMRAVNEQAARGLRALSFEPRILLPPGTEEETLRDLYRQICRAGFPLGLEIGGGYAEVTDAVTRPVVTGTVTGIPFQSAQDAGNIVYWDASVISNWKYLYFRVGTDAGANASADCKVDGNIVPGTDRFYKVTTASFTNMRVWAITNKEGWTGNNTNGVYNTKTGDEHAISKSTEYQDYAVDEGGVTLVPSSSTGTWSLPSLLTSTMPSFGIFALLAITAFAASRI